VYADLITIMIKIMITILISFLLFISRLDSGANQQVDVFRQKVGNLANDIAAQ
jgi:hypothetical protein